MLPKLYNRNEDDFWVIAHRGASAYYPENTMEAFKGAVEMGADMIELDVVRSRDGIPVVFHDELLEKHTDGKGRLRDFTLNELQGLDAGSWFDKKYTGIRIPTLEEVLEFATGTIALNIELKPEAVTGQLRGGIEEQCLELVKKFGMQQHVLISSFDYRAVHHLKALNPDIPAGLLYTPEYSGGKSPLELVREYEADAFHCGNRQLKRRWVNDLNAQDIPLLVYTVDRKSRMRKLINAGVRGIFTNKPDVLKEVVNWES